MGGDTSLSNGITRDEEERIYHGYELRNVF